MLIKQLFDLRKLLRSENSKCRSDLRDQVMGGWSVFLMESVFVLASLTCFYFLLE